MIMLFVYIIAFILVCFRWDILPIILSWGFLILLYNYPGWIIGIIGTAVLLGALDGDGS